MDRDLNKLRLTVRYVSFLFCILLGVCYLLWAVRIDSFTPGAFVLSFLSVLLFCAVVLLSIEKSEQLFGIKTGETYFEDYDKSLLTYNRKINFLIVLCAVLVLDICMMIAAVNTHATNGILQTLNAKFQTLDLNSYVGIAELGYKNTDTDQRLYIVFFPLYPMLLKVLHTFIQDYILCGIIISNFFAVGCGIVMFELALFEYGLNFAKRAVKFMYLLPATYFFVIPMTESIFLFFTLLFFLFLRQRRWYLVFCAGLLAGLSRSNGILLTVPFFIEVAATVVEDVRKNKLIIKQTVKTLFAGLGPVAAFSIYLYINYRTYKNPFQFMVFQKEHWHQSMTFFWNTVHYTADYLNRNLIDGKSVAYSVFGSNMFVIFFCLVVMLAGVRKLRASYTCFALFYYIFIFGPTWLLSGPRYTCVFFVLPLYIAAVTAKKKYLESALTLLMLIVNITFYSFYFKGFPLY